MRSGIVTSRVSIWLLLVPLVLPPPAYGWGREGHRLINRAAAEMLPSEMPAFLRSSQTIDELEALGPEPDRWRAEAPPGLRERLGAEHFIDLELADLAAPSGLPADRQRYRLDMAAARRKYPGLRSKLTVPVTGALPWEAIERFNQLERDMREYRVRLAADEPVFGCERAILEDAGILGHYVADGSQPLHTTIDYNGWVERDNPQHFTRERGIHSKFESDFVRANFTAAKILPLIPQAPGVLESPFADFMKFFRSSHTHVEDVYRIERSGGFEGHGTAESRSFTAERLAAGATMLRDMVWTAWVESALPPNARSLGAAN